MLSAGLKSSTKHLAFAFAKAFGMPSPFGEPIFVQTRSRRSRSRSREPERQQESDPEDDFWYCSDSEEAEWLEESEPLDKGMKGKAKEPDFDFDEGNCNNIAAIAASAVTHAGKGMKGKANCNNIAGIAASAVTHEGKGMKGKAKEPDLDFDEGKKDCEDPDAVKGSGKQDVDFAFGAKGSGKQDANAFAFDAAAFAKGSGKQDANALAFDAAAFEEAKAKGKQMPVLLGRLPVDKQAGHGKADVKGWSSVFVKGK